MSKITDVQRSELLSQAIAVYIKKGYKLSDKNDIAFTATLYKEAQKTNHILHLLLTLCTCFLWLLIWGGRAATKKGSHSIYLKIDEYGKTIYQ